MGDSIIRVGEGVATTQMTADLSTHVEVILGNTVTSIGTVEGRLEGVNVHGGSRYFAVYDDLTGERIQCHFGHRISAHDIGLAVEKRVAVQGEIRYRENGEIVSVNALSLSSFPPEHELPTADDVLGILEG